MGFFHAAGATALAVSALTGGPAAPDQAASQAPLTVTGHTWSSARTEADAPGSAYLTVGTNSTIEGYDGCNWFTGTTTVNENRHLMTTTITGMTRRWCENPATFDVTKDIAGAHTYTLTDTQLIMLNSHGNRIVLNRV